MDGESVSPCDVYTLYTALKGVKLFRRTICIYFEEEPMDETFGVVLRRSLVALRAFGPGIRLQKEDSDQDLA
jgi:hypothetical protein